MIDPALNIVQELIYDAGRREPQFDVSSDVVNWDAIKDAFLNYDQDRDYLNKIIERNFEHPEQIIDQLPNLYVEFIRRLALDYSKGKKHPSIQYFLEKNNKYFLSELEIHSFREDLGLRRKEEIPRLGDEKKLEEGHLMFEFEDNLIQDVITEASREELRNQFKNWDTELPLAAVSEPPSKSKTIITPWLKYTISVAALIIFGFFLWQPGKKSNEELFNEFSGQGFLKESSLQQDNEQEYSVDPSTRGIEEGPLNYSIIDEEEIVNGLRLLEEGNFDKAKLIFEKQGSKYNEAELQFYMAVASLNSNEVERAVSTLENLAKDKESTIKGAVKYNLALANLKMGERKKAREIFNSIISEGLEYSEEAKIILQQMRWP
ncbi:tetratricopeptide repeat protein [Kriegella aquimaris]|uniref:Tetratricopeptide repeat-containing protein n=1 Tax=Kriegella aquimaris TaxID=192904 RepID=A0A1G9LCL0_9FLAO|nr:tetratricopeptide repeat protein [Kriegella aquimaris]SDL59624.1 hypothetical protein SAMN04488514_1028 [Kriegella aquimaris]